MSVIGPTVLITGELRSSEELTVEGRVHGPVHCEDHALIIAATADIRGDVVARDIIVFGKSDGQLIATEVVDIRAAANVTGQVVSKKFILADGAMFGGQVAPQHLEAALRVARFKKKDGPAAASSPAKPPSD